jgi:nicotinate dehydrogenase subunit B
MTAEMDRRRFLGVMGSGLAVLVVPLPLAGQESGRGRGANSEPTDVDAWLHVGEDGRITVFTGKVEFGQDIRTSLAQAVAEELHAPLASIQVVMGDTELTPFDMGTFGSRTTPTMAPVLRRAAAVAREALVDLAARLWTVERTALTVAEGRVSHAPTSRSAGFGELTKGQKLQKSVPADIALVAAASWKVLGQPASKTNGREIVTGRHKYTSDLSRPGLLHGKVLRAPAAGATLASADTAAAAALPGVVAVREEDFVGVAAPTALRASRAREAVRAEWKTTSQPSAAEIFDYLKKTPAPEEREGRAGPAHAVGSVADALAGAAHRLEQTYTVAYIAHAPLEPRAAVAEWLDGKLTVWTGTQRPFGVRGELAEAFHLREDQVRVIVPDTGGGFGGKHTGEVAIEAARLARAARKPVKVVWTREEEFAWAYFRPAGVIEVKSGTSADGKLVAWEFHNYNSGPSAIRTLYDVPNQAIEFHPARSPLRQGSYRGLAATANHFAREVHMDEAAQAAKVDTVEFRFRNLSDPRLRAVLEAAADKGRWDKAPGGGAGRGIACGFEKGSYTAATADLAVEADGRVRLQRLVVVFECGAVINPDRLKAQVEGAAVQGIGGALFEAIDFADGRVRTDRFSRYRVPRFSDVPPVEVVLLDRKDLPSAGAGETPIVGVAPAIGNALFAATGVRLRAMPLAPQGVPRSVTSRS